jgi:hypothetical protein
MQTKRGEATKWARELLENSSGLSVTDFEEYAYGTTDNFRNKKLAQTLLRSIVRKLEKNKVGLGICRQGIYFIARKNDGDEAQGEIKKRSVFSLGTLQSVRRGAEVMYKQFPKLTSEMRIALLELVGKAKDLEIVMLKEGKE